MNETMYTRTQMLIGDDGLSKLKAAHVAVIGVGGVGSYIAESLARSGIGALTLIDKDTIAPSNINRQLHALTSTVGQSKTDTMAIRLREINPTLKVTAIHQLLNKDTTAKLITKDFDYVADAIDMVTAKLDLINHCQANNIKIISSMGTGNKLDPEKLQFTDIYKTHTDPLAKIMRRELKTRGVKKLEVVYSPEAPIKPLGEDGLPLRTPSSLPFVPASAGLLIASIIVRRILGEG